MTFRCSLIVLEYDQEELYAMTQSLRPHRLQNRRIAIARIHQWYILGVPGVTHRNLTFGGNAKPETQCSESAAKSADRCFRPLDDFESRAITPPTLLLFYVFQPLYGLTSGGDIS